jgi:hypothetical protein
MRSSHFSVFRLEVMCGGRNSSGTTSGSSSSCKLGLSSVRVVRSILLLRLAEPSYKWMVRLVRWLFRYRNGQVRRVAHQQRCCRPVYGNQNERQGVIPDERFPGHAVINPKVSDEDFQEAVQIAQAEFDKHQPAGVVGSSRGGAVAMNLDSGTAKLVLHSRADDVVPFADSEELVKNSGLPASALLWPAWKKWGTVKTVKAGTVILIEVGSVTDWPTRNRWKECWARASVRRTERA